MSNNEEKSKRICVDDTMTDNKKRFLNINPISNYLFKYEEVRASKIHFSLFKALIISAYIYYQNKNFPSIEFIHESSKEENLNVIAFKYNLSDAAIDNKYSSIIFSPIRIEPRLEHIKMSKNFVKENSLLEF